MMTNGTIDKFKPKLVAKVMYMIDKILLYKAIGSRVCSPHDFDIIKSITLSEGSRPVHLHLCMTLIDVAQPFLSSFVFHVSIVGDCCYFNGFKHENLGVESESNLTHFTHWYFGFLTYLIFITLFLFYIIPQRDVRKSLRK